MNTNMFCVLLLMGMTNPAFAVDFDGMGTGGRTIVVQDVPAVTASDTAGALKVVSAVYKEGVLVTLDGDLGSSSEIMLGLFKNGRAIEEKIVKRDVAGRSSVVLAAGQVLAPGSYSVEMTYRSSGRMAEGRQSFTLVVGDTEITAMKRAMNINPDDYQWSSISCAKKDEKTYRQETEWKIMKKDKTDYYVCDQIVTYEGFWLNCNESNPHTAPGMCVCASAERKYSQNLTNNCHWEAQWW